MGIRGERLAVPTRDDKRCVYTYTAMNLVTGSLSYALVNVAPKHLRDGKSKTRVMQDGLFAIFTSWRGPIRRTDT